MNIKEALKTLKDAEDKRKEEEKEKKRIEEAKKTKATPSNESNEEFSEEDKKLIEAAEKLKEDKETTETEDEENKNEDNTHNDILDAFNAASKNDDLDLNIEVDKAARGYKYSIPKGVSEAIFKQLTNYRRKELAENTKAIYESAGGEAEYKELISLAVSKMTKEQVASLKRQLSVSDVNTAKILISGLKAIYKPEAKVVKKEDKVDKEDKIEDISQRSEEGNKHTRLTDSKVIDQRSLALRMADPRFKFNEKFREEVLKDLHEYNQALVKNKRK